MLTTTITKIRKTSSITLAHDMGGAASFKPIFNVTFPFFLITITTTITIIGPFIAAEADDDSRESPKIPSLEDTNGADNNPAGAPQLPPSDASTKNSGHFNERTQPFKPSTAIVVGALTTMFSLTIILLLYVKHCNGGNIIYIDGDNGGTLRADGRRNSGIDPAVLDQLPIFRFRSLRGQKEGLDCAVCIMRFEDHELLRLLPKCKHAFHMECVDKWLDEHSTCPLCRYKVDAKDIVTRKEGEEEEGEDEGEGGEEEPFDIESGTRRVPGRHSSVTGENDGAPLEIVSQDSNDHRTLTESSSRSKSLDIHTSIITSRGFFARPKREATLLKQDNNNDKRDNLQHRLDHRIFIDPPSSSSVNSNGSDGVSDLLYITSEMIIHDEAISRRRRRRNSVQAPPSQMSTGGARRTVSDMAELRRFLSIGRSRNGGREGQRGDRVERERRHREGVVTRWSAWISRLHRPRGDVR